MTNTGEIMTNDTFGQVDEPLRHLDEAANFLQEHLAAPGPQVGIILGSGLGEFANCVQNPRCVSFSEVPHMKMSTATGHVGRFVAGSLGAQSVLVMQGRLHGYEGYSPQDVAFPVWLMWRLGVRMLITTNAAGAINPAYHVGDFCVMADQINLTGRNPICGIEPTKLASRFFSMKDAFDPALRSVLHGVAHRCGITLQEGVYLGLLGPSFETPAEIHAFACLGADTVAMSVCEEVIAARHVGMRVCGISLVSNMACGVQGASPSDAEVLEVGSQRIDDFCRLMCAFIEAI